MTPVPPHRPQHGHPDDEHETPDVSTVPSGAVAVFQAPRAVRPTPAQPPAQVPQPQVPAPPARPDIESPFLDLVTEPRRSTVDGHVVGEPAPVPSDPGGRALVRTRQPATTGKPRRPDK